MKVPIKCMNPKQYEKFICSRNNSNQTDFVKVHLTKSTKFVKRFNHQCCSNASKKSIKTYTMNGPKQPHKFTVLNFLKSPPKKSNKSRNLFKCQYTKQGIKYLDDNYIDFDWDPKYQKFY